MFDLFLISPSNPFPQGLRHSIGLSEEGKVFAWGSNVHGRLGVGHTKGSPVPIEVPFFRDKTVITVQCGGLCSMAVTSDRVGWWWGEWGWASAALLTPHPAADLTFLWA